LLVESLFPEYTFINFCVNNVFYFHFLQHVCNAILDLRCPCLSVHTVSRSVGICDVLRTWIYSYKYWSKFINVLIWDSVSDNILKYQ
jgi:hypothetical protein